jgi:excisionase family DNA binding protein
MQLGVSDAARILSTTEDQIYTWIDDRSIPFYEVSENHRFHRAELLEWAVAKDLAIDADGFASAERVSLSEALERGGTFHLGAVKDTREMIEALVARVPIADERERELIAGVFFARAESLAAIADKLYIPHVRAPIIVPGAAPSLTLCFFEQATAFLSVTPTAGAHLHLLAQLFEALRDPGFKAVIARRASTDEVLREARRAET